MLPSYAFYFHFFGALDTFFVQDYHYVAMSNVMKKMEHVICCVVAISAEPRRRVLLQWVIIIIYFCKGVMLNILLNKIKWKYLYT